MRNCFTLIFCLLILPMSISGQKSSPETRTMQIRHNDHLIVCSMLIKGQESIKTKRKGFYYWYDFDQIYVNEGAFSGLLLHGNYRVFDLSGKLVEQGCFDTGQKNGVWTKWDLNGFVINEVQWKNGRKTGALRTYEDGNLLKIEHFKDGVLHGKVMRFDSDGTYVTQRFRKGELVQSGPNRFCLKAMFRSFFNREAKPEDSASEKPGEIDVEFKQ